MRLTFRFPLYVWLLVCLSACASNNTANPQQTGSASIESNTQSNAGNMNESGAANASSAQPPAMTETASAVDACSLITKEEIAKIQGASIKEAKSNQRGEGEFLMSQCFYAAEEFVRSVSLTVIQPNPSRPGKQPKQYFIEKFREARTKSGEEREKEREREGARGEKAEEEASAERVGGLGDGAYWVRSGPSASLYVLKENQFLILSIGGGDAEPLKLKKTKALARQALKRLK